MGTLAVLAALAPAPALADAPATAELRYNPASSSPRFDKPASYWLWFAGQTRGGAISVTASKRLLRIRDADAPITPSGLCHSVEEREVACPMKRNAFALVHVQGGLGQDAFRLAGNLHDVLPHNAIDFDVEGEGGADVLYGSPSPGFDVRFGAGDGSLLEGGPSRESMTAGVGRQTVIGRGGRDGLVSTVGPPSPGDVFDGGPGTDSIQYTPSQTTVSVDLAAGSDSRGDQLTSVENVFANVDEATIAGDDGPNDIGGDLLWHGTVEGRGGNDRLTIVDGTLKGGPGDDFLNARQGVLDGGPGNDHLEQWGNAGDVRCGPGIDTLARLGAVTLVRRSCEWLSPDGGYTIVAHQPVDVTADGLARFRLTCDVVGWLYCRETAGIGRERSSGYAPRLHRTRVLRSGASTTIDVPLPAPVQTRLQEGKHPVVWVYVREELGMRRQRPFDESWRLSYKTPLKPGDQRELPGASAQPAGP